MKNYARFTVRCSLAERAELEVRSGGNLSEYARKILFEGSEELSRLEARVDDLTDTLIAMRLKQDATGAEIREVLAKAMQPIVAPAQDNSRLEGMTLELLLILRGRLSTMDKSGIQATVESEGLPVWESSSPQSSFMASGATERRTQVEEQEPSAREEQSPGGLGAFVKKWRS